MTRKRLRWVNAFLRSDMYNGPRELDRQTGNMIEYYKHETNTVYKTKEGRNRNEKIQSGQFKSFKNKDVQQVVKQLAEFISIANIN